MIVPALLSGLALGLAVPRSVPGSGQERPQRPRPEGERPKFENLVKLPDDFVQFARVPEGGLSPRVGLGKDDLALIYFKGEETRGDLWFTRSSDEARSFAPSQRLNPEPASVAAFGSIHRGAVDVGPDGMAHVVWITAADPPALLYAQAPREGPAGAPIEVGAPPGLCSTAAVTVDGGGQIYVFYAASDLPGVEGEDPGKRVWMRRSTDGTRFSEPVAIDRDGLNVSEGCAMAAHVDELMGTVFVLYRTAYALKPGATSLSRGMRLLSSENRGDDFKSVWVDNWKQTRDPRSSAGLTQEPQTTLATWDSGGQVFWATIRRQLNKINLPMDPRVEGPEVVRSQAAGAGGGSEIFLAWIERPKDDREATPRLAWRIWLREGRVPIGDGIAPEPPGLGTPVAFARRSRGFTVLY